ncbi:MAG: hypothetical protein LBV30_06555 [Propionibacteriaceae bacterium]|nr:hypothetical protein [Propionibacteriaceae bacterium]
MSDTYLAGLFNPPTPTSTPTTPAVITPVDTPPTPAEPAEPGATVAAAVVAPVTPPTVTGQGFAVKTFTDTLAPSASQRPRSRWFGRRRAAVEEAKRLDVAAVSTHWPQVKTVVVANTKGKAGKTPTAILTAAGFGVWGGTNPVLLDANPRGNLAARLETPPTVSLDDLLAAAPGLVDASQTATINSYTSYQPQGHFNAVTGSGFTTITDGEATLLGRATISAEDLWLAWSTLARIHPVITIDTGNNIDEPMKAALSVANALVVPLSWQQDYCDGAYTLLKDLDQIDALRPLIRSAIIINMNRREDPIPTRQAAAYRKIFTDMGLTVVDVPYDPHIGARGPICWNQLTVATRDAVLRLDAAIAHRFGA